MTDTTLKIFVHYHFNLLGSSFLVKRRDGKSYITENDNVFGKVENV